jgi:TonB-dependent starch-binding outer membrane protein SusC
VINQPDWVLDRWRKEGDKATIQRFNSDFSKAAQWGYASFSDAVYRDASYLRLKNLSFSWQVPAVWSSRVHIQNCSVYVQAQNLFTITSFKGLDPETLSTISLPTLRMITVGLKLVL